MRSFCAGNGPSRPYACQHSHLVGARRLLQLQLSFVRVGQITRRPTLMQPEKIMKSLRVACLFPTWQLPRAAGCIEGLPGINTASTRPSVLSLSRLPVALDCHERNADDCKLLDGSRSDPSLGNGAEPVTKNWQNHWCTALAVAATLGLDS